MANFIILRGGSMNQPERDSCKFLEIMWSCFEYMQAYVHSFESIHRFHKILQGWAGTQLS